jgi:DedD protein
MEKKKLLLVAVSVGVVLLIVIGIPLAIVGSRQNARQGQTLAVTGPVHPSPIQAPAIMQEPEAVAEAPVEVTQPVEPPTVTTITVPAPRTVAVPDAPVRTTPRTTARPAARPVETAREPARTTVAARPAVDSARMINSFWVQTGAFRTHIRAEGVKEPLETKGITSIIENRDIDGKTWYRVRVGPYTSENEANYWLTLVKSIDGFGDSQIRQTQTARQ